MGPARGDIYISAFSECIFVERFLLVSKNQVFDGYNEKLNTTENSIHSFEDYPEYYEDLKDSFLNNSFVKKHFSKPQQAWNDVATVNNDGSKAIIRNLDAIAEVLDDARKERYLQQLVEIRNEIINRLQVYYDPNDKEQNNIKVRKITGDIKLKTEFAFGERPELFGKIIDDMMVSSTDLRAIAYDIIVRHIEEPKSVSSIK